MTIVFSVLLATLISVVVYWCVVPQRHRSLFLFICSLLFIGSFSFLYAVLFLLHVAVVYLAGLRIRDASRHRNLLLQLTLVWLIGSLCFLKYANTILESLSKAGGSSGETSTAIWPDILFPLGISYITFRLIHYIVEVYRGSAPKGSFVGFALYVLFFPTFLAGPVERFPTFHEQTQTVNRLELPTVNHGLYRILKGVIKKALIADRLATLTLPILHAPADYSRLVVIGAVYGTAVQIYMDFSAYTDMAVGTARLFGYRVMENFNAPFFKHNVALFWRNWHISVYSWIRDYFFFPFFGQKPSRAKLYLGLLCSMMVFCLWHKASLALLVLGLYYGLGLIVWHAFQDIKATMPRVQAVLEHRWLTPLSILVTMAFIGVGPMFLLLDSQAGFEVLLRLTRE